jgi:hypothetical protein
MNLYNELLGENPIADKILMLLNMKREDFGRYRDIYMKDGGDRIIVYTRTGGASSAFFLEQTKAIAQHPLFVEAWDDSFDPTYHYITFSIGGLDTELAIEFFEQQHGEPITIAEKFEAVNTEMTTMTAQQLEADPRFARTTRTLREAIESGKRTIPFYDDDMPQELRAL